MKFFEMSNGYESRPVIYLDMDGVLADFFGTVAQHHGVKNWRDARKVRKAAGEKIDKIARRPGFFLHLKPLPNASRLIKNVLHMAGEYSILSSPLLSNVEQSSREKAEWLNHHLSRHSPQGIIFDHEKFKFARQADGTPNILIDDTDTNIQLWEANGGIGILYSNDECDRALKQLQAALAGKFTRTFKKPLAILKKEQEQQTESTEDGIDFDKEYWTNREVLKYIKGIHADGYSLDKPVLEHKIWRLTMIPTRLLSNPENYDQDDPWRRVIDIDLDHVRGIAHSDVMSRPIVAYPEHGTYWVLDGNHRVTAARAGKIKHIPAFIPAK